MDTRTRPRNGWTLAVQYLNDLLPNVLEWLLMDIRIRNLDEHIYRRLKGRAALTGKTIGEAVSDAIRTG